MTKSIYQGWVRCAIFKEQTKIQDNTRTRPAHGAHAAEGQRRRTGGQAAPTTLLGQKTTTTPYGKDGDANGYPMKVCEMLQAHEGAYYLERVALWDTAHIIKAKKAIKKAFQYQAEGKGYCLVEVLGTCPTNWGVSPLEAFDWQKENMLPVYPLGVFKDKGGEE